MVVRNKVFRTIEKYRALLKVRQSKSGNKLTAKSNRSKNRILDFFVKNGQWPNRKSENKTERLLGTRFENYISKTARAYDSHLRRLAFASGLRITNNKRRHNVKGFKQEILDFIATHGRVPATNSGETIEGEGRLRNKLDYYTKDCNDMTLLGKVYETDKCHRSGIPSKYRQLINESLNIKKPLIRLV